jgi:hypothetical protein
LIVIFAFSLITEVRMNELFYGGIGYGEDVTNRRVTRGQAVRELCINGNREAFVNANFQDFYSLLLSGKIVWLNRNVIACKESESAPYQLDSLKRRIRCQYTFLFDETIFLVCLLNFARRRIRYRDLDMLLESQVRRKVTKVLIMSSLLYAALPFSLRALDTFLTANKQLKALKLMQIKITDDACDILGKAPHCLDAFVLYRCHLNLQRLFNLLGANE